LFIIENGAVFSISIVDATCEDDVTCNDVLVAVEECKYTVELSVDNSDEEVDTTVSVGLVEWIICSADRVESDDDGCVKLISLCNELVSKPRFSSDKLF
jgi:hypothetical protein